MLAWIEGELPAGEVARLESEYPKAAFEVRLMRGDAAAMRACAGEAAPSDLATRTIEALQREAMLKLVADEAQTASEPVRMKMVREPALARIGGWRVALAAGLALALGAGVYFASTRGGVRTTDPGKLAMNTTPNENVPTSESGATSESRVAERGTNEGASPRVDESASVLAKNLEASTPAADSMVADSSSAGVVESSLAATDRLLALAREGRLVMRVEGASRPLSVVEATAARDASKAWRLTKDVPDSVLASLAPVVSASESRDAAEPGLIIVSAEHMPDQTLPIGPGAMKAPLRAVMPTGPLPRATAYYAELSADGDTLDLVRTLFATSLRGEVEFEVLDTPMAIESPAGVDDVLWWTQSPANWSPRVTVPVVVTRR